MSHPPLSDAPDSAAPNVRAGSWYPWAVVGMLWFICFFNYADRQAIAAILPALEEEFGFSKSDLGLISSAFMVVYALTAPVAGGIGDRTSRKMLILGGLYAWSIVTGFTALCSQLWQFVFVRGAEGLGETFYFPASMSLVSDYHSKRTRSRAMSLHQTSVYAGTIGGAAFAGWMTELYGWRMPFVVLGVVGVVLGLVLAVFIREPQRNEAERRELGELVDTSAEITAATATVPETDQGWARQGMTTLTEVLQFAGQLVMNPPAFMLVLAFCGANLVALVFMTWTPMFLRQKYNLDLASAGLWATLPMQVASMVGSIVGGVLADHWAKNRPGGRRLVQALGLCLGAPFIYLSGMTPELNTVLISMACLGFGKGIYDSNIWASLYDVVPPEKRGKAVGFTNMMGWISAATGTYLFGVIIDRGYTMSQTLASLVFIYIGIAGLLGLASLLAYRRGAVAS